MSVMQVDGERHILLTTDEQTSPSKSGCGKVILPVVDNTRLHDNMKQFLLDVEQEKERLQGSAKSSPQSRAQRPYTALKSSSHTMRVLHGRLWPVFSLKPGYTGMCLHTGVHWGRQCGAICKESASK